SCVFCFFFSSRRRHTRFSRDWSSDVCSSDLSEADSVTMWVDPADVSSEAALGAGTTVSGFDLQIAYLSLAKFLTPDSSFAAFDRSEERRVGRVCRWGRSRERAV